MFIDSRMCCCKAMIIFYFRIRNEYFYILVFIFYFRNSSATLKKLLLYTIFFQIFSFLTFPNFNKSARDENVQDQNPSPVAVSSVTIEVVYGVCLGQTTQLDWHNFDREADRRIHLGWAAYGKLHHIFESPIPQSLKTKVCKQCVLPVMTYGAMTWTLIVRLVHKSTKVTHSTQCDRACVLGISLVDRICTRKFDRVLE